MMQPNMYDAIALEIVALKLPFISYFHNSQYGSQMMIQIAIGAT